MKLWLDDVRPAPDGYIWLDTVNKVKTVSSGTKNLERALSYWT